MTVETARAKVNLALHVTGRRADGLHDLDSIVVFADVGDRLTLVPADRWSLDVAGPFAGDLDTGDDNLVLRAAISLERLLPRRIRPAHLTLEKNLPVASGIGGGSADAAATLVGLLRLAGIAPRDIDLSSLALGLGADLPVCLLGKACRMAGIGERLEPLADVPQLNAVLVNPLIPLSTAEVFSRLGLGRGQVGYQPLPPRRGGFVDWLAGCRNDLEPPARGLAPPVGAVLAALSGSAGCLLARMSGSGATCFGLFGDDGAARSAATALAAKGWWAVPTLLS